MRLLAPVLLSLAVAGCSRHEAHEPGVPRTFVMELSPSETRTSG
jgi:hypothetical protein